MPYAEDVTKNIRETCKNMARFRRVDYIEMLKAHASQCHDNLRDSLGAREEDMWRIRLELTDREIAAVDGTNQAERGPM